MIKFTVPAPLLGYRSSTRRSLYSKRNRKYAEFKRKVLALAMEAGWKCQTEAIKDVPPYLSVSVRWKKNPRVDWKNLYGAIEDALFYEDQFVKPGKHSDVEWDTKVEEALVIVETWEDLR